MAFGIGTNWDAANSFHLLAQAVWEFLAPSQRGEMLSPGFPGGYWPGLGRGPPNQV